MMLKLAVLALIGLTVTQAQEPDTRCVIPNTRPATLLPHDTDCSLYYMCHLGQRFLMPPCPAGHLFVVNACVLSTQNPCTPVTVPPPGGDTTTEATTTVSEDPPVDLTTTTVAGEDTTTTVPTAPTQVPTVSTIVR